MTDFSRNFLTSFFVFQVDWNEPQFYSVLCLLPEKSKQITFRKYHLDFDKFDKSIHKLPENYPDTDQKLQKH